MKIIPSIDLLDGKVVRLKQGNPELATFYDYDPFTLIEKWYSEKIQLKFQGGLAGLAGQFPPSYMGSLCQGQAIGGIISAAVNVLSLAFLSNDDESTPSNSAFYCFLVATIFIIIDIIAFVVMAKTKFYKVCNKIYS